MDAYDGYLQKQALTAWKKQLIAGRLAAPDIERLAAHGAVSSAGNVATRSVLPPGGAQRLLEHVNPASHGGMFTAKELVTNSDAVQRINRNLKPVQAGGSFSVGHDPRPKTYTASKGLEGTVIPAQSGFSASSVGQVELPKIVPAPRAPGKVFSIKKLPLGRLAAGGGGLAAGVGLGLGLARLLRPAQQATNWGHVAMGAGGGALAMGLMNRNSG